MKPRETGAHYERIALRWQLQQLHSFSIIIRYMKRPIAITGAIIAHALLAAWMLTASAIIWHRISWRLISLIGIVLLFHLLGFFGLALRYSWARRYSIIVFAFYAFLNFGNLSKAAKGANILGILLSLLFVVITIWLLRGLTDIDSKQYLAKTASRNLT